MPSGPKLTLNLASLDVVGDLLGGAAVNLAAGGESGTKDLLDGTLEVLGHGLEPHLASDLDDLVQRDRLGVLDVLLLLAVPGRLLEGLDDQGGSGGHNRNRGLTVLDGESDRDTETLPVTTAVQSQPERSCASSSGRKLTWPWRYLHRPSWATDREDRSWGRGQKRHQPHHPWPSGG